MIDWLLELKSNIDHHGIRIGLIITLYAIYRKERRNMRLDKRDEAIFHNLKVLMEERGLGAQWHGQVKVSNGEVQSLKKLYSSLQEEISRVSRSKGRKKKMANLLSGKKKIFTFILLVLLNGLNDTLQLHLTPDTINHISMLGGGYIVIEGILDVVRAFVNKKPGGGTGADTGNSNTIESNR